MFNSNNIDDPIVYVYCKVVSHEFLCKNYLKYNEWGCSCNYKVFYVRNYVNCSHVLDEYDLIKYDWFECDKNNYMKYLNWKERMLQYRNNI